MATLKAAHERESRDRKFFASLQGIDIEDDQEVDDITSLDGSMALNEGFGIGMGLGYIGE